MSQQKQDPPGNTPFEVIGPDAASAPAAEDTLPAWKRGLLSAHLYMQRPAVQRVKNVAISLMEGVGQIEPSNPYSLGIAAGVLLNSLSDHLEEEFGGYSPLTRAWHMLNDSGADETADAQIVLPSSQFARFLFPHLDQSRVQVYLRDASAGKAASGSGSKLTGEGSTSSGSGAPCIYRYPLNEERKGAGPEDAQWIYWMSAARTPTSDQMLSPVKATGPLSAEVREACLAPWRTRFWRHYSNHVEASWDAQGRKEVLITKQSPPWEYKGKQGDDLLDRWARFRAVGIKRHVILHGPPGNGKSTLAREVSARSGLRTLFLPVQTLEGLTLWDVRTLCAAIQPELVILDDLDRLGREKLEKLLGLFEDGEEGASGISASMLIATTNNLSRLPQALRRPGRFDEVWFVNRVHGDGLDELARYLATNEGLDLSEEDFQRLLTACRERGHTSAHVRELARRIKALGLDEALSVMEGDLTFDPAWNLPDDGEEPRGSGLGEEESHGDEELQVGEILDGSYPPEDDDDYDDYYDGDEEDDSDDDDD